VRIGGETVQDLMNNSPVNPGNDRGGINPVAPAKVGNKFPTCSPETGHAGITRPVRHDENLGVTWLQRGALAAELFELSEPLLSAPPRF